MQIGDRCKNKAASTKMHKFLNGFHLHIFLVSYEPPHEASGSNRCHIKDVKKLTYIFPAYKKSVRGITR